MRASDTLTELLARREVGLSWLTLISAALLFSTAALPGVALQVEGGWTLTVWSPSGWPALAGLLWAAAALWVVWRTRAEGEPPEEGPNLLMFATAGGAVAAGGAGLALLRSGAPLWALGLWAVLAGLLMPWRDLGALTEADPGHRIERLWRLHAGAGRLLTAGALASLAGTLAFEAQGALHGQDSLGAAASLGMLALCGVSLAAVARQMQAIGASLDEVRLAVPDLPPQPSNHWLPRLLASAGGVSLLVASLGAVSWPAAGAVSAQLVRAGWMAPEDGRERWMVIDDRARRVLTRSGAVQVRFTPTGDGLLATAGGGNPAFWVMGESLSWYPQQLRDIWDVTELAVSSDGNTLAVGRRHGALQLRELPAGKALTSWMVNTWAPLPARAPGGRLHAAGDTFFSLSEADIVQRWDARQGDWIPLLHSPEPVQGVVPSPDGSQLALLIGSVKIHLVSVAEGAVTQTLPAHGARRVLWTPDGEALIIAGQGAERVSLRSGARQRLSRTPVVDAALDGSGQRLALAGYGVRILDAADGTTLLHDRRPEGGAATSVSWRPEGDVLAIGTLSGEVEMWWLSEHRLGGAR